MGNAFFGGDMSKSRRQFLKHSSLAILGAAAGCRKPQNSGALPPGAPPAFGTAPAVGPEILPATFAEAEKLLQVELTSAERGLAARSWRTNMAALYERRTGPRKVALEPTLAPWSQWGAALPGERAGATRDQFVRSKAPPELLPATKEAIAFAPLTKLSRWIEQRKLTSERLTESISSGSTRLFPSCAARSRSRRIWHARKRRRLTRRSPRATTAGRCTAFRGAPRICWTLPESRRRMGPSRSGIACPGRTQWW